MATTTTFYIPVDLWMLILPFLPVKTLIRIRAASKFFFSLINSDSDLVFSHLRRFPNNLQKTHKIDILIRRNQLFWAINERSGDGTKTPARLLSSVSHSPPEVITSLDGLILLKSTTKRPETLTVTLWNPSLRKTRNLSLPWSPSDGVHAQFGLGYDPYCKDYKVLAMLKWGPLWIYSVKSRYWTKIERECCGMCDEKWWSEQLPVVGGVSWVMAFWDDYLGVISHRLVCFDFATLKFRFAPIPYGVVEDGLIDTHLVLVMLKDGDRSSPAVVGNLYDAEDDDDDDLVIWTIDLDTMVWIKRYSGTQASRIYTKYWPFDIFGIPTRHPIIYIESLLLLN